MEEKCIPKCLVRGIEKPVIKKKHKVGLLMRLLSDKAYKNSIYKDRVMPFNPVNRANQHITRSIFSEPLRDP